METADVLAFGAHPDDVEIGCGGTLIKMADAGRTVVVIDLVRGELGTRGSAETRRREAEEATAILGAGARENLGLSDGDVRATPHAKRRVAEAIRRWRPELIFAPYERDRHPDHAHAAEVVYEGAFLAGLPRYETGQAAHRPERVIHYMGWYEFEPTVIVDVSAHFERKMRAIYAFGTQFCPDASTDPRTRLTEPSTDWLIRSRMAYYGSLIRARYGEGFLVRGRLEVEDPFHLRFRSF